MEKSGSGGGRSRRPPLRSAAIAEFAVVGGAALAAIFVVIPNQTSSAGEIGLSPALVPTVCAAAIGLLALFHLLSVLFSRSAETAKPAVPARHSAVLIGAAALGVLAVSLLGMLAGCTILALLVSIVLGERRIVRLALVSGAVAITVFAIGWAGI